ncbi:hypothetical protein [Tropicibacter oceani]|uniref:Lipid A biosynthesis acyltransferase n=1 Tax=Tropicibacter oceani TaxID=3058420 RepID=A0ABY8QD75_9RHOB|nr:hypothetical protein [Tropicibacter oceani]WGW02572.1 hypothetical protein QF118_11520 [Tropicibacter oceani]
MWDLLFSPTGLALYAGFWTLKLLLGAWVVRKVAARMPVAVIVRIESGLTRLKLRRVRPE